MSQNETVKVAVVQWPPVVHDAAAGIDRAIEAIREAAAAGARLVAFPETWLQGYLYWGSADIKTPGYQAALGRLHREALRLDDPLLQRLFDAAGDSAINVVISLHERVGASIFATQLYISEKGALAGRHRKLKPTIVERLVWAEGDGDDPLAWDMPVGRVGGLMCYEHHMALARHACAEAGTQIHVSAWPGYSFLDRDIDAATRQLAIENGCFVLVARELFDCETDVAPGLSSDAMTRAPVRGGSAIIGPDGGYIVAPVFDARTILYAELDLSLIGRSKWWFDPIGHYARPDVFQLHWDRRAKPATRIVG